MIHIFIIGFIFLMPLTAFSQPPSPSTTKSIEQPNADSKIKQNEPQNAHISPIMPQQQATATTNDDHKNKSSSDWWLVGFTGGLVLVTAILAWYTARLWKTTKKSLDITKESVDLARQEFISTHRPRLIVRSVSAKTHPNPLMSIENGKPIQFEWVVVNVGDSPCEIIESSVNGIVDAIPFDVRSQYSNERTSMDGTKIIPGVPASFSFISDLVFNGPPVQSTLRQQKKAIYFYGFIVYRDDLGNVRRTAYCRSFDMESKRFRCIDNTDYEYVD